MTEETKFDREKASFFSIVCYGIHSKLNSWIKNEFEKCIGQKPIAFYEYFLNTPITKERAIEQEREEKAYAPYLFRILNERDWIPEMRSMKKVHKWEDIDMVNSSFESLREFWAEDGKGLAMAEVKEMPILKDLISLWGKSEESIESINKCYKRMELEGFLNDSLEKSKTNLGKWLPFIQEYSLVVLPWLRCPSKSNFQIHACSISSKNFFFGEVMIFYPEDKPENEKLKEFKRELKKIVAKLYLPVLTLFENHWEEYLLNEVLKDDESKDDKPKVCECVFLRKDIEKSEEPLENLFCNIWQDRARILVKPCEERNEKEKEAEKKEREFQEILKNNDFDFVKLKKNFEGDNKAIAERDKQTIKTALGLLKKSLQYGKYIIASPGMLNEFKRISFIHKTPEEERKYLSSFLVIGGPGSGKDCMASIVQLLYPEYRFGKQYTINMAALKPGFLSVPLMSGTEMVADHQLNRRWGKSEYTCEMYLKGIFRKVWEDFLGKDLLKDKKKAKDRVDAASKGGTLPVVILDELNSLDIDAQGSLLRVLQNMKVQSLGSINEYPADGPNMNFLVVGVVNEPEESLTLESTLHRLSEQREIIGSLATSMLYEKVRNMRRLREDLYHRLIRDGKIDLKTLAERREDIPILFSFFVKSELPKKIKWVDIWFDLDVFEALMDQRINWEGNFRQLQSIAKKVVMQSENANREFLSNIGIADKAEDQKSKFYTIRARDVIKVLEKDYGVMSRYRAPIVD